MEMAGVFASKGFDVLLVIVRSTQLSQSQKVLETSCRETRCSELLYFVAVCSECVLGAGAVLYYRGKFYPIWEP